MVLFTSGHLAEAYYRRVCVYVTCRYGRGCGVHLQVRQAWRTDHLAGAEGRLAATGGGQVPRHHPAELCRLRHFVRYLRPYLVPIHHETASGFSKHFSGRRKFTRRVRANNTTTKKPVSSWPTVTSPAPVRIAATPTPTATSAKCGKSLSPRADQPAFANQRQAAGVASDKHWYLPSTATSADGWKNGSTGTATTEANVFGPVQILARPGLQPRAVTRDLDWGVPVPLPDSKGKVLYVWFDAPIGYISATKALFRQRGDANGWEKYWKSKDARLVHFIGNRDNIVFHLHHLPAMLHAWWLCIAGERSGQWVPEPRRRQDLHLRNWAVWLLRYLQDFPGKQDVLRYALMRHRAGDERQRFHLEDFQAHATTASWSPFSTTSLTVRWVLTAKYYNGKVPAAYALTDEDKACLGGDQGGAGQAGRSHAALQIPRSPVSN